MSFIGCIMPGPLRPDAKLLVRTTMPEKNRLATKISMKLNISLKYIYVIDKHFNQLDRKRNTCHEYNEGHSVEYV